MSNIDRGLDWARIPEAEQAEMEARAKRAKIRIEWTGEDSAKVLAEFDGLDFRQVGELVWDWQHGWFFFRHEPDDEAVHEVGRQDPIEMLRGSRQVAADPPNYGRDLIDVDPDARLKFNNELVEVNQDRDEVGRMVKLAELRGRLNMHRDETRDIAVIGAKVSAKRWLPKYLTIV